MSTQPTPTFGASGAEDITRIPVTGSSPRENYEAVSYTHLRAHET